MKIEVNRWLIVVAFALAPAVAVAQHEAHQASPQVTAQAADPAQLAACVESQRQTSALLDAASLRVETARQSNQPSMLRSAVEDLQTVLSSVRTQLGACTQLQATATPAGHNMANMPGMAKPGAPSAPPSPGATPAAGAVDPHAGHAMPAAPAAAHAGQVLPETRTATPPAVPSSARSHAGHVTPGAKASVPPAPAPSRPIAARSHEGAARTASSDAHSDHVEATLPTPATSLEELKCTSKMDAKTAPRMLYSGRMYYFCSEQDRAAFAKEPSKYAKAQGTAPAPTHAH